MTRRNVTRKLSRAQRAEFEGDELAAILEALAQADPDTQLFEGSDGPQADAETRRAHHEAFLERLELNERKRNERRVRELVSRWRAAVPRRLHQDDEDNIVSDAAPAYGDGRVIDFLFRVFF